MLLVSVNKKKEYNDIDVMRFVISSYDADRDGYLNYNEFLFLVKSKTDALNHKDMGTKSSSVRKLIPEGVRNALINLLINEYEYACRLNSVLTRLKGIANLDSKVLFDCLDFNKTGQLTETK
jgi:hypothetical protein